MLRESTDYVRLLLRKVVQAKRGWWAGIQLSAEVLISVLGRLGCHGGFASVVSSRRGNFVRWFPEGHARFCAGSSALRKSSRTLRSWRDHLAPQR